MFTQTLVLIIFKQTIDHYKHIDSYFTYIVIIEKSYIFWSKFGSSDHRISMNSGKKTFREIFKELFSRNKEPECIKRTSSKWSGIISPPQPLEE